MSKTTAHGVLKRALSHNGASNVGPALNLLNVIRLTKVRQSEPRERERERERNNRQVDSQAYLLVVNNYCEHIYVQLVKHYFAFVWRNEREVLALLSRSSAVASAILRRNSQIRRSSGSGQAALKLYFFFKLVAFGFFWVIRRVSLPPPLVIRKIKTLFFSCFVVRLSKDRVR